MRYIAALFVTIFFAFVTNSFGQQRAYSFTLEQQDDPGYVLYKSGYHLVLQANWKDAQKKFEQILKFYPKVSKYYDDASYWYAYCLKYQDQKKALEAYKKYLKEFPTSRYRRDALEDLAELQTRVQKNIIVFTDSLIRRSAEIQRMNDSLYRHGRKLRVQVPEIPDIHVVLPDLENFRIDIPDVAIMANRMSDELEWGIGAFPQIQRARDLDKNARLKLAALRGIAADQDEDSFNTVKDFLLDRREHPQLRIEALSLLGRYRDFDTFPILEEIAKNDPDTQLRIYAIDLFGRSGKNKDVIAEKLIDLYAMAPKEPREMKERLISSIGRLKTKKGRDFLIRVAKTDPDTRMREGAIYFIGTYETDKDAAFTTLVEIYDAIPKEDRDAKERVISFIGRLGTDKSVDFLTRIANSDEDYSVRESALYYLGRSKEGKKALHEILRRK